MLAPKRWLINDCYAITPWSQRIIDKSVLSAFGRQCAEQADASSPNVCQWRWFCYSLGVCIHRVSKKFTLFIFLRLLGQMSTDFNSTFVVVLQLRKFANKWRISFLCMNMAEKKNEKYSVCFQCCRFIAVVPVSSSFLKRFFQSPQSANFIQTFLNKFFSVS